MREVGKVVRYYLLVAVVMLGLVFAVMETQNYLEAKRRLAKERYNNNALIHKLPVGNF